MQERFRASTDAFVASMTAVVLLLLSVVVVAALGAAAARPSNVVLGVSLVALVVLVASIVVGSYAYAPRAFWIDDGSLRIQRPASDVVIPLERVQEARPYDSFLGLSWKVPPGGNSGLFGLYGTFYRKDLGKFRLYGRRATRAVVLVTRDGPVVVTPDPRDAFVAALRRRLGGELRA